MSKEMKEQGLEMPTLSNSWSFTSKAKQPKGKSAARARLAKKSDKSKSDKPKSDKPKKKSGKETSSD